MTNGTWTNVQDGWTFTKENGEKAVSCWIYTLWGDSYEWYYFNAEGKMATGWVEADGVNSNFCNEYILFKPFRK